VLLSDRDLRAEIDAGRLILAPFDPTLVEPASIDVRLDRHFRVFRTHRYAHIDPAENQEDLTELVTVADGKPFILHPGEFVLGTTFEKVTLPDDLAAQLDGKSSLGRLGLLVHSTAGWVDPLFSGQVTLELSNVAGLPIKLWPGMKIGQLVVTRMQTPVAAGYGAAGRTSRYQDQVGPTASRSHLNFRRGLPPA
jgi:dCTP deaminase